jgi:predicted RNA-binding Zn ribbon-like protein
MDTVVSAAVRLVNTLTPGMAQGRAYSPPEGAALRAAITAVLGTGADRGRPVSRPEAAALREVAADLRSVFDAAARGDVDSAARQINAMLTRTGARPQLDRHDGEPWHLHFHSAEESLATGYAAGCATGLAVVLGSEARDRLGVCSAPRCNRVYIDVSRNGTRRFCSTACQSRVKAAAFRARQA